MKLPSAASARPGTRRSGVRQAGRVTAAALIAFALSGSEAAAQDTGSAGGPGGDTNYTPSCPDGRLVAGLEVVHGGVIDRTRFRCRERTSTGSWGSGVSWTAWTSSINSSTSATANAHCSTNHFVGEFRVYTKEPPPFTNRVVARIQIRCYRSISNPGSGARAGTTSDVAAAGATASGGSWSGWLSCPRFGFARQPVARTGWYLDRLGFNCAFPVVPTAAPTITFPRWAGSASENTAATGSWQVRLNPVAHADRYRIRIATAGASGYYYDQKHNAAAPGAYAPSIHYGVSIPTDRQGTVAAVSVQACNVNDECGPFSATEWMTVVPNAPALSAPAHNSYLYSRTVAFSWQGNAAATGGYQLFIERPTSSRYDVYAPAAPSVAGQFQNVSIASGITSRTLELDPALPVGLRWAVTACANFEGKGRRCSLGYSPRAFTVPTFFAEHMAGTFRHARCVNCHRVTVSGSSVTGLPAGHPTTIATGCTSCHTNSLLPGEGTLNPGWQAPNPARPFENRDNTQLCAMAQDKGSKAANALQHLTEDKLILWAIADGRLPQGRSASSDLAPPRSTSTWRSRIQQWWNAGMPCP